MTGPSALSRCTGRYAPRRAVALVVTLAKISPMKPLLKCFAQLSTLVVVEWLLLTPPGNDVTRPQKEWLQERSFDSLQRCASYRERQADDWTKKMETVSKGSSEYLTYDRAATRFLLGKCVLAESVL